MRACVWCISPPPANRVKPTFSEHSCVSSHCPYLGLLNVFISFSRARAEFWCEFKCPSLQRVVCHFAANWQSAVGSVSAREREAFNECDEVLPGDEPVLIRGQTKPSANQRLSPCSRGGRDFVLLLLCLFCVYTSFCIQTTSSPSSASRTPSSFAWPFSILILPTSKFNLIHHVNNRPSELPPSPEAARAVGQADIAQVKMRKCRTFGSRKHHRWWNRIDCLLATCQLCLENEFVHGVFKCSRIGQCVIAL